MVLSESRQASEQQNQLMADVNRIIREISNIAHDNLHRLSLAGQSVQHLEQASNGLVESVRRFNTHSEDHTVDADEGHYGNVPQLGL